MSLIDRIFRRGGGDASKTGPEPPAVKRGAPQTPPRTEAPERAPPALTPRTMSSDAAVQIARAAALAAKPPPASLPGSDPGTLAAIGDAVRARLEAHPGAVRMPALNVDMYSVDGFLSAEECVRLVALVDADAKPSTILRAGADPSIRTSHTCKLPGTDPLVAEVERRMADLLGIPISHSETVQGQRYAAGQQFKMHNDYFAAGQPYSETVAKEGGQRTWTAMVFLNEPEAGGSTHFPRAGVKIAPKAGTLLAWNNLDRQGLPNRSTHHEGMQVEAGMKHILTKWFREREWRTSAESDSLRY
jgi:prolyl 4-hydroxylase